MSTGVGKRCREQSLLPPRNGGLFVRRGGNLCSWQKVRGVWQGKLRACGEIET